MKSFLDTIFALATPPPSMVGAGALAVLRISGSGCMDIINASGILQLRSGKRFKAVARRATYCHFVQPQTNRCLDDVVVTFFKGPASYTGEDCVEICFHASPYILDQAYKVLLDIGFSYAQPGEFTKRAVLNGKIDATQAEGIQALISAQTEDSWLAAKDLADGKLRIQLERLREEALNAFSYLNALIDFPEEKEIEALHLTQVDHILDRLEEQLRQLCDSFDQGRKSLSGLRVCILGQPNAGKSSLLNSLLGVDRAIVSEIPGTTRDYIQESFFLEGRSFHLIDTAGIRDSDDPIEAEGIKRSMSLLTQADIGVFLVPADADTAHLDTALSALNLIKTYPQVQSLVIGTKADLPHTRPVSGIDKEILFSISIHDEDSLKKLKSHLIDLFDKSVRENRPACLLYTQRQFGGIAQALESLQEFKSLRREIRSDHQGQDEEILASILSQVLDHLNHVIGPIDQEDVFDKIFSSFCIGK